MSIEPGTSVEIDLDPTSEGARHLKALVYEAAGKQYVVIAAGGGKWGAPSGGSYVAFALP